jgi:hypothetical protein
MQYLLTLQKKQAESGGEVVNLSAKKAIAKRWSKESKDSQ